MARMGLTLNIITLCALTLGVGMMVDNSIVVMESCSRVTDSKPSGFVEYMKDALEGARAVGPSVIASTVTTCVVFLPLAMLKGTTGQMLGPLGYSFETIIQGADYDEVKAVSDKIVSELMERAEVAKVHSDAENSSPVVEVTVDAAKAKAAGLTASSIGSTLSQMVSGIQATELDIDGDFQALENYHWAVEGIVTLA